MVLRYTLPPSNRQLKVAEEIRIAISDILTQNRLSHPFFEVNIFTVTEVRISQDLKQATVFLLVPSNLEAPQVIKFFNEIAARLRQLVTEAIVLKFSPTLRFVEDKGEP
jgi:ribosome-binding factor A